MVALKNNYFTLLPTMHTPHT